MKTLNKALATLLRDFGYRMDGDRLIQSAIRGFTSDRVMGRFPSLLAAAEFLCPIIREDEYTDRLIGLSR